MFEIEGLHALLQLAGDILWIFVLLKDVKDIPRNRKVS